MIGRISPLRHLQIKMDLSRQLADIGRLEKELESLLTGSKPSTELEQRIGKLAEEKQKLNYQIDILRRAITRWSVPFRKKILTTQIESRKKPSKMISCPIFRPLVLRFTVASVRLRRFCRNQMKEMSLSPRPSPMWTTYLTWETSSVVFCRQMSTHDTVASLETILFIFAEPMSMVLQLRQKLGKKDSGTVFLLETVLYTLKVAQ